MSVHDQLRQRRAYVQWFAEHRGIPLKEANKLVAGAHLSGEFDCVDCGTDTSEGTGNGEYYRVVDAVWAASGLGPQDGMLCIGCLEARIGRRLSRRDFDMRAECNHDGPQSRRLAERLHFEEPPP